MVDCLLSGRPPLIVTGHFGNWEMAGFALGLLGFRTHAIARTLDNPYLDAFLRNSARRPARDPRQGERLRADRGGVARGRRHRDPGRPGRRASGLFVDFFGRPASTHKAVALLALEHGAVMAVTGTPRVAEPMGYHIITEEVIAPEEYEGQPNAVRSITQRFTAALERLVRRFPEQYFWLHRRWKHQPIARTKAQKAA